MSSYGGVVGQKALLDHLTQLVEMDVFPPCLILEGPDGQGKKTVIKYIADEYHIPTQICGMKVDDIRSAIESSLTLSTPRIFLFPDAHLMTIQAQNALLKLAEEPPKFARVILTVSRMDKVLMTIKSRSTVLHMGQYDRTELLPFVDGDPDSRLLEICTNPGQVLRFKTLPETFFDTCQKILESIDRISAANAFNILRHFRPEDYDLIIPYLIDLYGQALRKRAGLRSGKTFLFNQIRVLFKWKALVEGQNLSLEKALEMMFLELR